MSLHNQHRHGFVAMAAALLFFAAMPAMAHHVELIAEAVCDESDTVIINYTATSWLTTGEPGSGNPNIEIRVNGVPIENNAFDPPDYAFSNSLAAPGGISAIVSAVAIADWDDGEAGGQSIDIEVDYPSEGCTLPGIGRFTGGGHQIRVGQARVTRGLTIHCDLLLSNNLEINWGGNQFHMLEHLTTTACTDDPAIIQAPPVAPLDTLIGVGSGRYNGTEGYTINFTLQDFGEPGKFDRMAIFIFETANPANVVLDVPLQVLTGGNLQAHFDQPHK